MTTAVTVRQVRRSAPNGRRARFASACGALLLAVGLGACTIGESDELAAEPEAAPAATIATSYADGEESASVLDPVVLTASEGTFDDVEMTNEEGGVVEGEFNEERTEWRTTEVLGYNRDYSVEANATNEDGETTTSETSFSTVQPNVLTAAYMVTGQDTTVGIGQPVAVMFDEPISDRHAAQEAIDISVEPEIEGAFYWVSNQEVRWRPQHYWEPGTTVEVVVDIYGKDLGNGMYGQETARSNFTIGDAVVTTIDDNTKTITVRRNGEVVKTMPTALGKSATPTPNGIYYVAERNESMIMDSSTYGVSVDSPEGYRTPVQYATRLSYSGIFIHAAPWSLWAQGNTNVSHGCPNVSTADAKWFFDNSKRGDIVEVYNTVGPTLPPTDGLGDWNMDWETWKAGNADQSA